MAQTYRRILVPVDGSTQSIDAFKRAVQLAKGSRATLFLVTVIDDGSSEGEAEDLMRTKEQLFRALEDYAQREGVALLNRFEYGDAKRIIAEELVRSLDIDLIVMGATGKGRMAKVLLGSITNYVTRHARCDVLVAR